VVNQVLRGAAAINQVFDKCRSEKRAAFIPYFTAGFPSLAFSYQVFRKLASLADLVEVGFPFSDPLADGPTIQAASQKALQNRISLSSLFVLAHQLKKEFSTPLILMTYLNPVCAYGLHRFEEEAFEAGFDGVIFPDLPLSEVEFWREDSQGKLAQVLLAAPNNSRERLEKIAAASEGFVYCVSVTGVTGVRSQIPPHLINFLSTVKEVSPLPIAVGFGISQPEQVKTLAPWVDGVVVGSVLIDAVLSSKQNDPEGLEKKAASFLPALAKK
jgi:tryptophan synthase alpha chain